MSQLYHRHQSRGLRAKQVTVVRPRCPVTGQLLGPGQGRTVAVEGLHEGKPNGKRTGMGIARMSLSQHFQWAHWRRAHNVQVV